MVCYFILYYVYVYVYVYVCTVRYSAPNPLILVILDSFIPELSFLTSFVVVVVVVGAGFVFVAASND
jgi:hypothetical protein